MTASVGPQPWEANQAIALLEHRARDLGAVVAVHLDIGQAAVVIDHAVGVLDADPAAAVLLGAIAVGPVARALKARQLLGVHVKQSPRF